MVDVFAALDAAIDRLRPAASSRSSRDLLQTAGATGTSKPLENSVVPVLLVVPVPNREVCGSTPQSGNASKNHDESAPPESNSFSTESTGSTGSCQDSCGVRGSRGDEAGREVTGTTGSDTLAALNELDPHRPPGDVPLRRWQQYLADARAFITSGFAEQAMTLGWTEADLFGCDDTRPFARIDQMGLVWLLNGDHVVAITADAAVIEARSGARLTMRRKSAAVTGPFATDAQRRSAQAGAANADASCSPQAR